MLSYCYMLIWQTLLGLGIMGLGYAMVRYSRNVVDILGVVDWAERTFTSGGSIFFYKLLGIAVIILGIIVTTNLYDLIMGGLVSAVF